MVRLSTLFCPFHTLADIPPGSPTQSDAEMSIFSLQRARRNGNCGRPHPPGPGAMEGGGAAAPSLNRGWGPSGASVHCA